MQSGEESLSADAVDVRAAHRRENNTIRRVGKIAGVITGAAIAGVSATGVYLESVNDSRMPNLTQRVDFGVGDKAEPSDDMANMFDDGMNYLALGGGIVLAGWGVRGIRRSVSDKEAALTELAKKGLTGSKARKALAAGGIAVLSSTIFGVSHDVGKAVGGAQVAALGAIIDEDEFPRDTALLSKSGNPELATTPSVPNESVAKIFEAKERIDSKVDIVPIYYTWESAIREKDKSDGSDKKILTVVMGLPSDVTDLPQTKESDRCETTFINAAPVLGNIGDKVTLAGNEYVIHGHLDGSGPNTVPIAMNFEDYAKCFTGNEDQPFHMLALRGDEADVAKLIKESGVVEDNELKKSTIQDFFDETDRTSKNNSNGLVLTFLSISAIASAAALGYKAKSNLSNERGVNSMLLAQGLPRRDINRINKIRADREALWSTFASMPLVAVADYSTVVSTPGAVDVAPSPTTFLVVLAATTGIGRLANLVIAPSELHKLNPAKRGVQA